MVDYYGFWILDDGGWWWRPATGIDGSASTAASAASNALLHVTHYKIQNDPDTKYTNQDTESNQGLWQHLCNALRTALFLNKKNDQIQIIQP